MCGGAKSLYTEPGLIMRNPIDSGVLLYENGDCGLLILAGVKEQGLRWHPPSFSSIFIYFHLFSSIFIYFQHPPIVFDIPLTCSDDILRLLEIYG